MSEDWKTRAKEVWDAPGWREVAQQHDRDIDKSTGPQERISSVVNVVLVVPEPEWPKMDGAAYQGLAGEISRGDLTPY